MAATTTAEPYGLHPKTEAALATLCSCRPYFYARVGQQVVPASLSVPPARLAVRAVQSIAEEGQPPGNVILVLQRLKRWQWQGQATEEEVKAVEDMFAAAELNLPSEEELLAEVVPVIRRRLHSDALQLGMQDFANRGDMARVSEILDTARHLGERAGPTIGQTATIGGGGSVDSVRAAIASSKVERLSFGVPDYDSRTDGGLWRGALGVVVAGTGCGKSMALSTIACEAVRTGHLVAFATLELPVREITARAVANLVSIPTRDVLNGRFQEAEDKLLKANFQGGVVVEHFTAHATSVSDLEKWVQSLATKRGRMPSVLVVDYADQLIPGTGKKSKEDGSYTSMRAVYDSLRNMAIQYNMWVWTASQARRAAEQRSKNYKLDAEDVSDSMHKSRVADMIVTLNARDDGATILFNVAKNRMGASGEFAGPLPHDFTYGRIAMVSEKKQ